MQTVLFVVYTPTERVFVCRDAGEPGGDGGGEGPAGSARLLCPPVHPSGQVSQGELLQTLEMPGRETPLGPVPVRRLSGQSGTETETAVGRRLAPLPHPLV
jgi:hypothetical protein